METLLDWLVPYYTWLKAGHVISVIAWMAGIFYLPRLFVYHSEKATLGSELDQTFQIMEERLLRVIMNPAMIATWLFGILLLSLGVFDFSSWWAWLKISGVVLMTGFHMWLAKCRREFAAGTNRFSGRTYRLANEIPTVLMFVIVIAVIVRPF